jgi:hypothetical protein
VLRLLKQQLPSRGGAVVGEEPAGGPSFVDMAQRLGGLPAAARWPV